MSNLSSLPKCLAISTQFARNPQFILILGLPSIHRLTRHILMPFAQCSRAVFQIDVTVNAPKAGKITELLAEEEATVSVGQDLFKLDPDASGECT